MGTIIQIGLDFYFFHKFIIRNIDKYIKGIHTNEIEILVIMMDIETEEIKINLSYNEKEMIYSINFQFFILQ